MAVVRLTEAAVEEVGKLDIFLSAVVPTDSCVDGGEHGRGSHEVALA